MNKITALRTGKGRSKRVNVFLDGKYSFSLEADVAVKEGLQEEQVLSTDKIKALAEADNLKRCFNAASLLLSYRPRSESELKQRLHRRGFTGTTVDNTILKLREVRLVDDTAFARFWKENRDDCSPRSRSLIRLELRQKGVAEDLISRVMEDINDEDNAYRAGVKKARSLSRSDYQQFRRRLGDHLRRRGFNYGVINSTVNRLWQEQDGTIVQEK